MSVGSNGYVTAVAVGQRQRFYSGVRMFTWYYPSFFSKVFACIPYSKSLIYTVQFLMAGLDMASYFVASALEQRTKG
jgi:hypothetical protein